MFKTLRFSIVLLLVYAIALNPLRVAWAGGFPGSSAAINPSCPVFSQQAIVQSSFISRIIRPAAITHFVTEKLKKPALPEEVYSEVVLDIGAGNGGVAKRLATSHPSDLVIAIEPDSDKFVSAQHELVGIPNVKLLKMNVSEWVSDKFEGRIAHAYFNFLKMDQHEFETAVQMLYRSLKPGASFIITGDSAGTLMDIQKVAPVLFDLRLRGFDADWREVSLDELPDELKGTERYRFLQQADKASLADYKSHYSASQFLMITATKPKETTLVQSLIGHHGGPLLYGFVMPFIEEVLRISPYLFLSRWFDMDPFLWFVGVFPIIHALLHTVTDIHEVGVKRFWIRFPLRLLLSAGFGVIGWLVLRDDPSDLLLAFNGLWAAHMINNLFLDDYLHRRFGWHWLTMSIHDSESEFSTPLLILNAAVPLYLRRESAKHAASILTDLSPEDPHTGALRTAIAEELTKSLSPMVDPYIRYMAIEALAETKWGPAIPALIEMMGEGGDMAEKARTALEEYPSAWIVESLLKNKTPRVFRQYSQLEFFVDLMTRVEDDKTWNIVRSKIQVSPLIVEILVRRFDPHDDQFYGRMIDVIKQGNLMKDVSYFFMDPKFQADAISDNPAVQDDEEFYFTNPKSRSRAASILSMFPDQTATLVGMAKDSHDPRMMGAAAALVLMGSSAVPAILKEAMPVSTDGSQSAMKNLPNQWLNGQLPVTERALILLGALQKGSGYASDEIRKRLEDADPAVAEQAAHALFSINDPTSFHDLIEAIKKHPTSNIPGVMIKNLKKVKVWEVPMRDLVEAHYRLFETQLFPIRSLINEMLLERWTEAVPAMVHAIEVDPSLSAHFRPLILKMMSLNIKDILVVLHKFGTPQSAFAWNLLQELSIEDAITVLIGVIDDELAGPLSIQLLMELAKKHPEKVRRTLYVEINRPHLNSKQIELVERYFPKWNIPENLLNRVMGIAWFLLSAGGILALSAHFHSASLAFIPFAWLSWFTHRSSAKKLPDSLRFDAAA